MSADLDWADFELVERIAAAGTLSAAARALGVDQTTASRRLGRAEKRLGGTLFDRIDGRLVATPLLERSLPNLRAMAELAAETRSHLARGRAELEGRVRVTSLPLILSRLLAPALGELRRRHPRVAVDLLADNRSASFERREADIAIRLARPAEDIAIARRIGGLRMTLLRLPATGERRAGEPVPIVTYDEDLARLPEMQVLAAARPDAPVAMRSNQLDIVVEGAIALGAEAMIPDYLIDKDPRIAAGERTGIVATREVWLLVHPERRRAPSVAAVADWIVDVIGGRLG